MKVPNKTHYALKIMVDMAMSSTKQPSTVAAMAERAAIPRQFLQQILLGLKSGGLVRSERGLHGGYLLIPSPDDISVGAVVRATQGEFLSVPLLESLSTGGIDAAICELWDRVRGRLEEELEAVTIRDLCRRSAKKTPTADYTI